MWKGIALVYLVLLSVYDIREKRIPLFWLEVGGAAAVLLAVHWMLLGQTTWIQVLSGTLPGLLLLAAAWLTRKMGYGDGLVLLQLGILLGYRKSVFVLCASLFLCAVAGGILLALRRVGRQSCLAYLPFLTGAYLLVCCVD